MKEMVGGCCVCSDERGWPENPLVYCDGANCNVAVHQACYGIVTVPTGPWYCRKCESQERSARVRCELCPSRTGALKKTNTSSGWAHVVCALYIPEVRFGNVTTMEPINLDSIPIERYGKTCYICQEMNKGSKAQVGACMQCNKSGCRQQFHVTCAQQLGLLCEEAGNYLDNVKYCGYCQHHYSKLKKGGNVKLIPPYKPITYETGSSDGPSSPEKESDAGATTSSLAQTTTTTASMLSSAAPMATQSTSSAPVPISTSASSSQAQLQKGSTSSGSSLGLSQGGAGASSLSSASSGQQSNVPSTANSQSSGTGSSSSSNSKQRKSSSASKSSNSSSSSSQNATPTTNTNASQSSNSGSTKSSANVSSSSSGNSTSGKDFKDKHSKAMGKVSSSKEKDSLRDKSSKSNSNSSSNSSSKNSKDNSLSSSGGAASNQDSQKGDPKSEKSSSTSSSSLPKSIPGGSILAPSVLQSTATVKETMGKFSTANFTDNSSSQDNATSFGNEISAKNTANNSGPVSKKRKASDNNSKTLQQQQQQQLQDDKSMMKDVSVTLIPLRSYEKGNNDQGDVKKVKTEGGSPLQLGEPNLQNVSPNLLATQTGATSISITKQPMSSSSSSSSSNVIIKPPIIKDLGALHSASSPSTTSPVTTPSLVVSVPLSTASGAAGLNLNPTSNANLSSASSTTVGQNLFQQAIQNRTEHLNFSNATTRHSNPINRASPVITVSNSTQQQQQQQQSHHQSMADHQLHQIHHRQSPLVMQQQQQSNALVVDNGSRASLSPTVSGHSQLMASGNLATIQQSDSGMLKITYEKQQSAIVTPPSSHRLSAIQDDIAPGRRSRTPDSSYSTFGSVGSAASGGGGGGGGLKFSYEAQSGPGAVTTASTLLTPSPSPSMCQLGATPIATNTIGAQPIVKDSPPSSPNSEAGSSRKRTRKQEAISSKDMKIFQNGIHASHMLGNQLNPSSSVAQKMSDQLHMELEAHSVYTVPTDNGPQLIGPPFPGKQNQSNNAIKSAPQGPPSLSSMLSGSATATAAGGAPQSLEQLLERQWEQGSQFLMEQAQHFDIASLLSCLHQLRTENIRLEDHVNSLVARRDHLLAVNARLAIPLNPPTNSVNQGQFSSGSGQPVVNGPVESSNVIQGGGSSSGGRGSGGRNSSSNVAASNQHSFNVPLENGIDFRHSMAQQQSQAALHASQHSQQLEQSRSGGGSGVSKFVGTMHR